MPDDRGLPNADEAAAALTAAYLWLSTVVRHGWMRSDGGFVAGVTGLRVPTMNGVWAVGPGDSVSAVERWLDEVESAGLPFCLQTRPGAAEAERIGRRRGMTMLEHVPLMGIGERVADGGAGDRLSIERLAAPDRDRYLDILTRGFEVPAEMFAPLVTEELLDEPSAICLVGSVGDTAVTTGLAVVRGSSAGIFNVATPPEHRRRGYGAAITASCLGAAREAGATWGYLQSSEMGVNVYERLGFRTLERWSVLVHEGAG